MAQKSNKRKVSSWVTPSFDDFGFKLPSTEKKSKRPRDPGSSSYGKKPQKGGSALWVDLYAPTTRDDLAVHKKKVQEVESWLVESMAGMKGRRVLLISGPSGCGKSATVRVLGREAGLSLVEWINPLSSRYESAFESDENTWIPGDTVRQQSQTDLFRDFFIRTSKYKSVCDPSKVGNLMLVEDFPNVFLRDPSVFHALLRQYQQRGSSPVVFIVCDSTNQQTSIKHLFPPDVQQDLSIVNIQFNAIASGILLKALNRILSMNNLCEGSGPLPQREALESLIETSGGDIRSAVNALQFAVTKDVYELKQLFTSAEKSKPSSKTKARSRSTTSKLNTKKQTNEDTDGMAIVGGKDASLFLFRALGKILYCKRDQECGIVDSLPKNLKSQERTPLLENAEDIFDKMAMGASSLSTFLHQNMTPFYSDIDAVAKAQHHLTDSDILAGEWLGRNVLENYAASVTIRGLMHANNTSSWTGGWRAFTKPQWFSIHKQHQQHLLSLKGEHAMASVTSEELTTVLVPLEAKIFAATNKGHFTKTKELGLFSNMQMKNYSDKLGENDANADLAEDELFDSFPNTASQQSAELSGGTMESNEMDDDPEEDFRIDEFPD